MAVHQTVLRETSLMPQTIDSNAPLVSIVLPSFNGADYIAQSIESCLAQTYTNIELIIVNDGSTDDTLKIAETYANCETRVHVVNNPRNLQLPASLNTGFREAKGQYFSWTSDDNLYRPQAIQEMTAALQQNDADLVYCAYDVMDMKGKLESRRPPAPIQTMAIRNVIGACFLYKAEARNRIGEYNPSLFGAEDYDYWSRMCRAGLKLHPLNQNLYIWRRHNKSLTQTKGRMVFRNAEKVMAANLRAFHVPAKDRADVYRAYYKRSSESHGWLFAFKFYLKYLAYRMQSSLFLKGSR